MYKVTYSLEAENDIQQFISYLRTYFEDFYSNTWIDNIKLIIDSYNEWLWKLYDTIKSKIYYTASGGLLGCKILSKNNHFENCKNIVLIRRFRFVIESRKYDFEKIVYIEKITYSTF